MVLRSREQCVVISIVCALATTYWIVFAVRGYIGHDSLPEAVFGVAMGIIFAIVLVRASRARAVVDELHLTVVNTFRTTRVNAAEIREFQLGPRKSTIFYGAAAVELRDGQEIVIFGIQSPNTAVRPDNNSAQKLVDQLNDWLIKAQAMNDAP